MRSKRLTAVIFCPVLAACQAMYEDANEQEPFATLKLSSGEYVGETNEWGADPTVEYKLLEGACSSSLRMALFPAASMTADRERRVAAGKPVRVLARTRYGDIVRGMDTSTGNYSDHSPDECVALAEFTPQVGVVYEVTQNRTTYGKCVLEVTDLAANMPPSGLSIDNDYRCGDRGA